MAGLSVFTIIPSGPHAGNIRRDGRDLLNIQPLSGLDLNTYPSRWDYKLSYLPHDQLLVTLANGSDIHHYQVDLTRQSTENTDTSHYYVDYLGRDRPFVEELDPARDDRFAISSTDGSGRFIGVRGSGTRRTDEIYDFNREWPIVSTSAALGLYPGGYLAQDILVITMRPNDGYRGYLIPGPGEVLVGGTESHIVTRNRDGDVVIYPYSALSDTQGAARPSQGQIIGYPQQDERVYILPDRIVWQDVSGIRAYENGKVQTLMPASQATHVRLVGAQILPGRPGFLYQVQLRTKKGDYAVIQGDHVVARSDYPMILTDRIWARVSAVHLFGAILPGTLARYLQRAV